MDRQEARLLLQACRPNGDDATRPAFAEALAQVERDPELKVWWEAEQAFDRKFAAKLQAIPLPPDLRAKILAGGKLEPVKPRFALPHWLAIAALVVLLGVIGVVFMPSAAHPLTNTFYDEKALAFLGNDDPSLGMMSSDHTKVAAWLKQQHSPVGAIPLNMASLPSEGCQTFAMRGHTVSLICFAMSDGGVAHLFIIEKRALADPPGLFPEFKQTGSWSTASWSDDRHTYFLASEASPEKLKQLL